jgi:hypothetical protein
MVRLLLTLYWTVITLAGPALCCCTDRCELTSRRPSLAATASPLGAPGDAGRCPHCRKQSEPPTSDTTRDDPADPSPCPDPDCPCRHLASEPVITGAGAGPSWAALLSLGSAEWLPVGVPSGSSAVDPGLLPISTAAASVLPFLTAQDLLRVHHVLRC